MSASDPPAPSLQIVKYLRLLRHNARTYSTHSLSIFSRRSSLYRFGTTSLSSHKLRSLRKRALAWKHIINAAVKCKFVFRRCSSGDKFQSYDIKNREVDMPCVDGSNGSLLRLPAYRFSDSGRLLYFGRVIYLLNFFSVHQIFDVPGPIFAKICHTTRYVHTSTNQTSCFRLDVP